MRTWNLLRSWLKQQGLRRPPGCYLQLEELEDRAVPATLTVNTTSDLFVANAVLSLREAIEVVNEPLLYSVLSADEQKQIDLTETFGINDTILFALGNGEQIISPSFMDQPLPAIEQPVYIDGANPTYPTQIIRLDGQLLANANVPNAHGLHLKAADSNISNLVIGRFTGDGIRIESPDAQHTEGFNFIEGNLIGTNLDGLDLGNTGAGVRILNSSDNKIGFEKNGNTIYKNLGGGIVINGADATNNYVIGNRISTNTAYGILLDNKANDNVIGRLQTGGTFFGEGNTIINNSGDGTTTGDGILIKTDGNKVAGNHIGMSADGGKGLRFGNKKNGITISGSNNHIGGNDPALRNVISANKGHGIEITNGSGNWLTGNYIGLTIDGTAIFDSSGWATGNEREGVLLTSTSKDGNFLGGVGQAPNVISGNDLRGIHVKGTLSAQVSNNIIGRNPANTTNLLNGGDGIRLENAGSVHLQDNESFAVRGARAFEVDKATNVTGSGNNFRVSLDGTGPILPAVLVRDSDDVTLGGLLAADSNVIDTGIEIINSTNVTIQGNYIGQDSMGTPFTTGLEGILIDADSSNVTIGGLATGAGNHIFSNGGVGIQSAGTNVVIQGNDLDQDEGVDVEIEAGTARFTQPDIASLLLNGGIITFEGDSSADDVTMTGGTVYIPGDDPMMETTAGSLSVTATFDHSGGTVNLSGGQLSAGGGLSLGASASLFAYGSIIADVSTAGSVTTTLGMMGTESLLIDGNYTQTGGTTEVATALEVTGNLSVADGDFTAEDLWQPVSVDVASFTQSGGSVYCFNATLLIANDFLISDGDLYLSSLTLEVGGDMQIDDGTAMLDSVQATITGVMQLNGGTSTLFMTTLSVSNGLSISSGAWLDVWGSSLLGNLSNAGTLSIAHLSFPTAGDTFSITGNYTQTSTGTLILDVDDYSCDQLSISGAACLDGSFVLNGLGGYDPVPFTTLTPLTYGSRSGTFSSLSLPTPSSGTWIDTYYSTYFELYLDDPM